MPYIRMSGLKVEICEALSNEAKVLGDIVKTDASNFTFESLGSQFFEAGVKTLGNPFIEIIWFPRPQDTADKLAEFITNFIKSVHSYEYVTIIFTEVARDHYFENGKHF